MQYIAVLMVFAALFGLFYLIDKGFTRLFRSKAQHRSGLAVRASKRYASIGMLLAVLGLAGIFSGLDGQKLMLAGGILLLAVGIGLIVYYITFGIYYDQDTMLLESFGKKGTVYRFESIRGQKLYQIQGGSIVVELYLEDGRTVTVQAGTMEGVYPFLDHAFAAWCRQKETAPEDCSFHDPANHLWFPSEEEV